MKERFLNLKTSIMASKKFKNHTVWMLFDSRAREDLSKATLYEICDTLKEAQEGIEYYGEGTVLVEAWQTKNTIVNEKIIN